MEAGSAGEALHVLKQHELDRLLVQCPALPVLLMSGSATEEVAARCSCCFLKKPFTMRDLVARLHEALRGTQKRLSDARPGERSHRRASLAVRADLGSAHAG